MLQFKSVHETLFSILNHRLLILLLLGVAATHGLESTIPPTNRPIQLYNFPPASSPPIKLQSTQALSPQSTQSQPQLKATQQGPTINQIKPLIQALATPTASNVNLALGASGLSTHPGAGETNNVKKVVKQLVPSKISNPDPSNSMTSQTGTLNFNGNNINSQEDPITYLDYSSINDEVLRKNSANFVYFNANFNHCRHCYRFFNIWKDLALDIRWWRQVIRLYTINCSDEDNIEMCRRAGVTQFPQVRYYWVMSNSLDQDGQRLRVLGKSVHAMRHLIMDKVLDSYLEHNKLIAQRAAQKSSNSASGNPLLAFMPVLSQLMGQPSASGTGSSGGLASIVGLMTGKSTGSGGLPSFGSLINQIGGFQGLSQIISALSSAASMRKSLYIQALPKIWPELDQLVAPDTQRLLDMLPNDPSRGALLIMETQEFLYTGLEVILDLIPYMNSTYVARVRDERSQLSKNLTSRDDIQAPALIYITESREPKLIMAGPKYTNDEDLRRAFVKAFDRKQVKYPVKRVWAATSTNNQLTSVASTETSQENEDILQRLNYVHMSDLTNALRSSLMEQVFRHPDLSDDQYNALVRYVYVLINYFPFNNEESLKFVRRLHTWLQNQVSPMDISEYKKQFHDVDEALGKREWVACKSLSNTKAIPSRGRKSGVLFENPAQFGKIVSNITRLLRANQQKAGQLKNLLGMFAGSTGGTPVMLSNHQQNNSSRLQSLTGKSNSTFSTTVAPSTSKPSPSSSSSGDHKNESPIERIVKSLTSGSLGSDSSMLKLISTALTGAGGGADGDKTSAGSKSKFAREYPCGAWKLAHVMVVNEYIKDSPRKDVKHIVLHSLYQYMLNFYACPTCGNRVSDVTGEFKINLEDHLLDQGDSIMLIWKLHNKVNKRLESELRPGSPPKQQFPSESLCPKCRGSKPQNDLVSTPNWYEKQVLNFLVHHYRPQSIIASDDVTLSDSSSTTTKSQSPILDGAAYMTLGISLAIAILTGHVQPTQSRLVVNR